MAFIAAPPGRLALSAPQPTHRLASRKRLPTVSRRRVARLQAAASAAADDGQTPADAPDVASIPGSLDGACEQAIGAIEAALDAGNTRLFLEIDLTNGDETYTVLKSTLPALRALLPRLAPTARVRLLFPDAGSAALARRDWVADEQAAVAGIGTGVGVVVAAGPDAVQQAGQTDGAQKGVVDWMDETRFVFCTMEDGVPVTSDGDAAQAQEGGDAADGEPAAQRDGMIVVVVPRASETEALQVVVEATAPDVPVLVVNPDLVDMGVTGLSLNARRLQDTLISAFDTAYYLRVFPWGVLLRAWPGRWGVWVDEPGSAVGFRLIAHRDERPGTEALSDLLDEDARAAGETPGGGGLGGILAGFKRFLDVYTKG